VQDFLHSEHSLMGDASDLYCVVVAAEAFEGCAVKSLAMVRMGDADEKLCALLH